jgi:hypothetical protein
VEDEHDEVALPFAFLIWREPLVDPVVTNASTAFVNIAL